MLRKLGNLGSGTKPVIGFGRRTATKKGYCWACGSNDIEWGFRKIISDELAEGWRLNKPARASFDERESGFCTTCGCSYRLRQLAEAISYINSEKSLALASEGAMKKMMVAEINSCGALHQFFEKITGLKYSEYGSKDSSVKHEDLHALTYPDDCFDYVFTSDTLEHIPLLDNALKEIHRVLKPGGSHIFTVPIVWSRKTRQRATYTSGEIVNILEPTYHGEGQPDYLVFNEFGFDTIGIIEKCGFDVKVYGRNILNTNDASGVLIATKILKLTETAQ